LAGVHAAGRSAAAAATEVAAAVGLDLLALVFSFGAQWAQVTFDVEGQFSIPGSIFECMDILGLTFNIKGSQGSRCLL
jgi:hypothetical protein